MQTSSIRLFSILAFFILSSCSPAPAQNSEIFPVSETGKLELHQVHMTRLDRDRTIRVYLPPGYEEGNKSYPVIYMHDGQNLFEDATSFAGEWGVDESLDKLANEAGLEIIAVGIDNGGSLRMHELNPFDHPKYGHAEGDAYLDFVVRDLKPFIDQTYRTKPDRAHTAIMGSSLGGLISHYALATHPSVFSKGGLFSPSYWFAPGMYELEAGRIAQPGTRIYMLAGEKEEDMVEPAERMYRLLIEQGQAQDQLEMKVDPDGAHNEKFWKRYFPQAISWLFQQELAD